MTNIAQVPPRPMSPGQLSSREEASAPPSQPSADGLVGMFERLARDPGVSVEKLEGLIRLQERILAYQARVDFFAAFAQMQGELPTISERGEIVVNGQVRSTFARNEDIQEAVRPVLNRHGFALSFRHKVDGDVLTITGLLSHRSGHTEQDEFAAKADDSGAKNAIQQRGSTRSYGQRYCTIALLNIVTRDRADDDGEASGKAPVDAPPGFDDWWVDLRACADEGTAALTAAWNKSKPLWRAHLVNTDRKAWDALKARAAAVKA